MGLLFGKYNSKPYGSGKKVSKTDQLMAAIIQAEEEHGHQIRSGLKYVKFGDKWISIEDTDEIRKICGLD
jgi:hypothetical protein